MTEKQVQFIMDKMKDYTFSDFQGQWFHKKLDPQCVRGMFTHQLFDHLLGQYKEELLKIDLE